MSTASATASSVLSEEEQAIYDRQLRVWGVDAQKRMRDSSVLVIGACGLAAEVCKNLVLTGIGSLTLLDPHAAHMDDLASQFFLTAADIGSNRAVAAVPRIQLLNPNVRVIADSQPVESKPDDFFTTFDLVYASDITLSQLYRIDAVCRARRSPRATAVFASALFGMRAWFIEDLGDAWQYLPLAPAQPAHAQPSSSSSSSHSSSLSSSSSSTTTALHTLSYRSVRDTLSTPWSRVAAVYGKRSGVEHAAQYILFHVLLTYHDRYGGEFPSASDPQHVKQLLSVRDELWHAQVASSSNGSSGSASNGNGSNSSSSSSLPAYYPTDDALLRLLPSLHAQLAPVCAIVGGVLAQEMLKVVSGKDEPLKNVGVYHALNGVAIVKSID